MEQITWKKPAGTLVSTNDAPETVAYCESLGWKRVKVTVEEEKPKGKEAA